MQPIENSLPQAGCIQPAFVRYQAQYPNSTMTAAVAREKHLSRVELERCVGGRADIRCSPNKIPRGAGGRKS